MDSRQRQAWATAGYGAAGFVVAALAVRFLPAPLDIAVLVTAFAAFAVWRYKVVTREVRSGSPAQEREELPSPADEAPSSRPARPLRIRTRSTTRFRR